MATNDTSRNVTDTTTDAEGGYTAYFVDSDRVLYRERDGWPGEILNGDTWQSYSFDRADVRQIDEDEAARIAGGTPLDAPASGTNPMTAARRKADGYDGADGEGTKSVTGEGEPDGEEA